MATKHVLSIKGFEDLIEDIAKANGSIEQAAEKALKTGAAEIEKQLHAECAASGVPSSITDEIKTEITQEQNSFRGVIGWRLGAYDPNNLSQGFKALFLNYGTPRRSKHGKIKARGFIARAKKKSTKNVKTAQENALNEILKGLK